MKRLLILPLVATVCSVEIVRRGFAQPILYGAHCWWAAFHRDPSHHEHDLIA